MIIRRKKIKLNGKNYNIGVYTYHNNRIRLRYENNVECHDITLNLNDIYLDKGKVVLDPYIIKNGLMKVLKTRYFCNFFAVTVTLKNVFSSSFLLLQSLQC